MFVEQPPKIYRMLFPGAVWRLPAEDPRAVYLTFDDGPVPEVTPQVLDILDSYSVKATFFMVGENVARHPRLLDEVIARGHSAGNHTMHHTRGLRSSLQAYTDDVARARALIPSKLFRPPHGIMRPSQMRELLHIYNIIMYDVVTRDYSTKLTAGDVVANVMRYVRNGSIIVFHDSLRAAPRMLEALPAAIERLISKGYEFKALPMD